MLPCCASGVCCRYRGLASPRVYRPAGLLFEKHRDHFGRDGDDVLSISGPTEVFNPTIDLALIDKAREEDPESAEAEWDGGFRRDIAAFLSDHDIDAAVDHDRPLELAPRSGLRYRAFADPSGGRHDSYCLAIGHFEGTRTDGRFVLDVVRGAQPPFDPQTTTRAFAELLQDYGLSEVTGDTYAAEWVETAFRDAGIRYVRSEKPKSALYLEAQTLFARGGISLPDHPVLLRELRLLERRTHRSGKDSVDHGLRGHDDYANAVLGCAARAMRRGYDTSLHGLWWRGRTGFAASGTIGVQQVRRVRRPAMKRNVRIRGRVVRSDGRGHPAGQRGCQKLCVESFCEG